MLEGHSGSVRSVAFSPDGRHIASGSRDETVEVWEADGSQVALALHDGQAVELWDVVTGDRIKTFTGHGSWVNSVAFSPDGKWLASASGDYEEEMSASDDRTVTLWDTVTGGYITTFNGHSGAINSVAFSPDGRRLASASDDGTVKLWDVATRDSITMLEGHRHAVNSSASVMSVAFSPRGSWLASASIDGPIKLWDIATGKCAAIFNDRGDCVNSVAFSPDGRRLASASDDGTVKLWDVATRDSITMLEGHSHSVDSVAFSPDGSRLASASTDGTVKLWDVAISNYSTMFEGHSRVAESVFSPGVTSTYWVRSVVFHQMAAGSHQRHFRRSSSGI
jgi:WD40 repeat protein